MNFDVIILQAQKGHCMQVQDSRFIRSKLQRAELRDVQEMCLYTSQNAEVFSTLSSSQPSQNSLTAIELSTHFVCLPLAANRLFAL